MELREVEGEHLGPPGWPPPRAVQPRRDVVGLDDIEARRRRSRRRRSARARARWIRRRDPPPARNAPVRAEDPPAGGEPTAVPRTSSRTGSAAGPGRRRRGFAQRAPRREPGSSPTSPAPPTLPGRDDEPHRAIAAEQLDDPANALGRRHQPVEQRHSPGIPVNPVRAALGVHLENRVVAVEDPGPGQLDERAEIATEVRDAVDHRLRQPLGDLRLEHLGAAFDQRDDEVVRLRNPDEPVLDVEPDLRVIDMCDHEHPGVRPRALKPWLPTIRRELWMRQQWTGSRHESSGWRHFGRKESGGAKGGRGWARRQPLGHLPDPAAGQAKAGGETPQRRRNPPRRRGQEAFHLAPVLVCGRFQMGDPDEERFVLLAQRIEEVVWLHHRHSGHFIQASDAVRPAPRSRPERLPERSGAGAQMSSRRSSSRRTTAAFASGEPFSLSSTRSGLSGSSYGAVTPVKSASSPASARA